MNGVTQFLTQRISAIVIFLFGCYFFAFLINNPDLSYSEWIGFFQNIWTKVLATMALWMIVLHSWQGMWGVFTDYLTELTLGNKAGSVRLLCMSLLALLLLATFILGTYLFWII